MSRGAPLRVVTANDLVLGDVVYLGRDGAWVRDLRRAAVFDDPLAAEAALKAAAAQTDRIVGAYLAEVSRAPDGLLPLHNREAIRARGPSNYAHGKQVDLPDV